MGACEYRNERNISTVVGQSQAHTQITTDNCFYLVPIAADPGAVRIQERLLLNPQNEHRSIRHSRAF